MMNRRSFLASTTAALALGTVRAQAPRPKRVLLRSSWQTVNIGDIAHTPGMLKLIEQHHPNVEVTLWPSSVGDGVEQLLMRRFPRLRIATREDDRRRAIDECDIFLHGSGPGFVGARELERWRPTGKPYGIGGITLNDGELQTHREALQGAAFIFCRDTDSLRALEGVVRPNNGRPAAAFGPDATFHLDLRDDERADTFLRERELPRGEFLCAVPRLRWTPYWIERPSRYTREEIDRRQAENDRHRESDHGKMREAIIAWVRETRLKVLLCPEMTYQVELLRPLLFDPLPDDVKRNVVVRPGYWLPGEAASTYARAAAVISCEMHSPIIAFAVGTPAIHLRQPTDTRKGQMWRDIGLGDWLFEIDRATGAEIATRLLAIRSQSGATRDRMAAARERVNAASRQMMDALGRQLG